MLSIIDVLELYKLGMYCRKNVRGLIGSGNGFDGFEVSFRSSPEVFSVWKLDYYRTVFGLSNMKLLDSIDYASTVYNSSLYLFSTRNKHFDIIDEETTKLKYDCTEEEHFQLSTVVDLPYTYDEVVCIRDFCENVLKEDERLIIIGIEKFRKTPQHEFDALKAYFTNKIEANKK